MLEQRKQLCRRLRQARKESRLNQEHVAQYLSIPISAVSSMENGGRKVDAIELFMLTKLYNKSLEWFFHNNNQGSLPTGAWYHGDPLLAECIRLLQESPKQLQQSAAHGIIGFLKRQ